MHSKRAREGYLLIDNRLSGGAMVESAFVTCGHCQASVILNPDRTRARNHCRACDRYVCDLCAGVAHKTGVCTPFAKILDAAYEAALRPTGD